MKYWLIKSEPESYSIDHLKRDGKTEWTGVRNFQARNFMREMEKGDQILFYHSNCSEPGVYGIAKVTRRAAPDETQFDKSGHYFEPRATREKWIWDCAQVGFVNKFKKPVLLGPMKIDPVLKDMFILRRGSRLSVTPVSKKEFERIMQLGE